MIFDILTFFNCYKKKQKTFLIKILNFSRVLGIQKNVFFNLKKKFDVFLPLENFLKLTNFRSFSVLGFLREKKEKILASFNTLGNHMTHGACQNS